MDKEREQDFKAQSLAFFGAVTASVSHELNNVIAIINELTGLLDDMRYSAEQGQQIGPERLKNLHERLERQVKRGEKIVKRLNKFAHSADQPIIEFDLNFVLGNLVDLTRRLADMKMVTLIYDSSEEPFQYTGNPFELQHILFRCIRLLLDSAEKEATVLLTVHKGDSGYTLEIDCSAISVQAPAEEDIQLINDLAKDQGADLQQIREGSKYSFILTLPVAKSASSD
jgi:C4-dicarboxylate-specific signal transduction histidine kinase